MVKKRKTRKKKSFNLLNLWGSWVGVLIGVFVLFPILMSTIIPSFPSGEILDPKEGILLFVFGFIYIISLILSGILGFFIGGGIHSFFRKLRN